MRTTTRRGRGWWCALMAAAGVLAWQGVVMAQSPPPRPPTQRPRPVIIPPQPVFEIGRDAERDVERALVEARKLGRRVLLMYGYDDGMWARRVFRNFTEVLPIRDALLRDYVVVLVEIGRDGDRNEALMERFAPGLEMGSLPHLSVVAPGGEGEGPRVVVSAGTAPLRSRAQSMLPGLDTNRFLLFLREHAGEPRDARELLSGALPEPASDEGARAIVCFVESNQAWSRRFHAWIAGEGREAMGGVPVIVIDVLRERGSIELFEELAEGRPPGVPWVVALDAERRALAHTGLGAEYVGYPVGERECEVLARVLRAAGVAEERVSATIASLRALESPIPPDLTVMVAEEVGGSKNEGEGVPSDDAAAPR